MTIQILLVFFINFFFVFSPISIPCNSPHSHPYFPHFHPDFPHSHPYSLHSPLIPPIPTLIPRIPNLDSPHSHPDSLHSHPDSPHSHFDSPHPHPNFPRSYPDSLRSHHSPHSVPRFPIPAFTYSLFLSLTHLTDLASSKNFYLCRSIN